MVLVTGIVSCCRSMSVMIDMKFLKAIIVTYASHSGGIYLTVRGIAWELWEVSSSSRALRGVLF